MSALDPVREAQGRTIVLAERARLAQFGAIEREQAELERATQPGGLRSKLPLVEARSTELHASLAPSERDALSEYVMGNHRALRALDMGATPAQVLEFGLARSLKEAEDLATLLPDLRSARKGLVVERPTRYGPLYRGINVASEAALARLLTGESIEFIGSINSSSYLYQVAREFAGQGEGARVILEIPDVDRAVSALYASNDLKHEAEMIIGKTEFRIVSRNYDPDTNTYLFRLEQLTLTKDAAEQASKRPAPPPPGVGDLSKFISDGSDIRVK